MTFKIENWARLSSSANNDIVTLQNGTLEGAPCLFSYISNTDTLAQIAAPNYFVQQAPELNLKDLIYTVGTDGQEFLTVTALNIETPTVNTSPATPATGNVIGPASSTDNALVRWNGATGTAIKNSVGLLTDAGALSGLISAIIGNITLSGGTISTTVGDLVITPLGGTLAAGGHFNINGNGPLGDGSLFSQYNLTNTFFTAIRAPLALAQNIAYEWPLLPPAVNGSVLTSTIAGAWTWAAPTGTGSVIFANSPTITTPNIVGVNNASNATSGSVGEFISSVIPAVSAVSISSGAVTNLTSIVLTPGDWDVWGNINYIASSNAPTVLQAWVSSTSATQPDRSLYNSLAGSTLNSCALSAPTLRFNVSTSTTIFISGFISFAAGTCNMSGGIYARRVR